MGRREGGKEGRRVYGREGFLEHFKEEKSRPLCLLSKEGGREGGREEGGVVMDKRWERGREVGGGGRGGEEGAKTVGNSK